MATDEFTNYYTDRFDKSTVVGHEIMDVIDEVGDAVSGIKAGGAQISQCVMA
jgi:D-arabinose 1-dehydrogenase-like Zn-dependent alcohol dehydrogenase